MPDDPYSLSDLASLADVTPRTVRYYITQGLLPSPEVAGPATRYGEGHLARLRLIKRLQRDHLPLSEIRARLERMGDDEVEALLASADTQPPRPSMSTGETLAYVRDLMTRSGVAPQFYDQPPTATREVALPLEASPTPPPTMLRAMAMPAMEETSVAPAAPSPTPAASTPAPLPPAQASDRSTWERVSITPDIEIHIRRPLDRRANKAVERLTRIARDLFDDEP